MNSNISNNKCLTHTQWICLVAVWINPKMTDTLNWPLILGVLEDLRFLVFLVDPEGRQDPSFLGDRLHLDLPVKGDAKETRFKDSFFASVKVMHHKNKIDKNLRKTELIIYCRIIIRNKGSVIRCKHSFVLSSESLYSLWSVQII